MIRARTSLREWGPLAVLVVNTLFGGCLCGGDGLRRGEVRCGEDVCAPGTYCDPGNDKCKIGCLSTANCGHDERCKKAEGQQVGSCVMGAVEPLEGKTPCGDEVCPGGKHCADPKTGRCEVGCLAKGNCAAFERCEKEAGQTVGVCKPMGGLREGTTKCGTTTCQPGHHCADVEGARCEVGCLTDGNCPYPSRCRKQDGQTLGTCGDK